MSFPKVFLFDENLILKRDFDDLFMKIRSNLSKNLRFAIHLQFSINCT